MTTVDTSKDIKSVHGGTDTNRSVSAGNSPTSCVNTSTKSQICKVVYCIS